MKNKKTFMYLRNIILIFLAVTPLIYYNQIENVPFKAFILGTGSWGIGNIFKIIIHQIVILPLQTKEKPIYLISFLNGLVSGIFELAASCLIILLMKDKFTFTYDSIISFGLAIGSFEILVVVFNKGNDLFKGTALEESSSILYNYLENLKGVKYYTYNLFLPIFERIIATFLHISTRGLVFITFISGSVIPILVALVVFIIADGMLGYYYHITGKLATSKGYIQIHLSLFLLAAISTVVFFEWMTPYKDIVL